MHPLFTRVKTIEVDNEFLLLGVKKYETTMRNVIQKLIALKMISVITSGFTQKSSIFFRG